MHKFIIGFIVIVLILAIVIGNCSGDSEEFEDPVAFVEAEAPTEAQSIDIAPEIVEEEPSHVVSFDTTALEVPLSMRAMPEQILVRYAYTTSYNKQTKCPNWVAWHLTRDRADGPYSRKGVPYYDEDNKVYGIGLVTQETSQGDYLVDMQAEAPRQEFSDWRDSSIPNNSHGHICPAADCKWSKTAMNQSFLLTNMCPQDRDLNMGDWEGLERRSRGWAKHYGDVYIVAGPIFYNGVKKTMGANKVGVPDAFFKVVLCLQGQPKAIGFIFPNIGTHHELDEYVVTVDEVEQITGFDFFHNLEDEIENAVEAKSELNRW